MSIQHRPEGRGFEPKELMDNYHVSAWETVYDPGLCKAIRLLAAEKVLGLGQKSFLEIMAEESRRTPSKLSDWQYRIPPRLG